MARPTTFTGDAALVILRAVRHGLSLRDACAVADVPLSTARGWVRRVDGFAAEVAKAHAEAVADKVRALDRGGWKGAAFWLERMTPEFAPKGAA